MSGKDLPEVFAQGIEKYGLNRSRILVVGVPFASSFSKTDLNPVRGLIAGTLKPEGINKGFQKNKGVIIEPLPIPGHHLGHSAQYVGGKIRDLDPRKNKKTDILGNKKDVSISMRGFPADEIITAGNLVCCLSPTNTGQRSVIIKDDILEVFTHCLAVAKIMISLDKTLV